MTREEAIAIAHSDPEIIVEALLNLSARIEDLEGKIALLTTDSSNSSKPPSSDGPQTKLRPRPPKKSKKRNRGGQPGHKGTNRELIPEEEVGEPIPSVSRCVRQLRCSARSRTGPADRQVFASSSS